VVVSGKEILDRLPDRQALVVETRLPAEQMADVAPGIAAAMQSTALKENSTPVVDGTVVRLSSDRLPDESSSRP
jgi:hypothetical protein